MMKIPLETGEIVEIDYNQTSIKALALRMGVIDKFPAMVNGPGPQAGIVTETFEDKLCTVIQFAGFEDERENGWVSLCIYPDTKNAIIITYNLIKLMKSNMHFHPNLKPLEKNNTNN